MKPFVFFLFALGLAAASLKAQVVESATVRPLTISVGGMGGAFAPNITGLSQSPYFVNAPADYLVGLGAYADFHFSHWVQIEGEARWLRLNQQNNESEDQYLIGPKVPILRLWRANVYGKAMIGVGKLRFARGPRILHVHRVRWRYRLPAFSQTDHARFRFRIPGLAEVPAQGHQPALRHQRGNVVPGILIPGP
jgi:hypothetical protein